MDAELDALDDRIRSLIRFSERLRSENVELRQQLAAAQAEGDLLREKVSAARTRLESLLARMPGEDA
ncbi:MAG: hypothetical protein GC151_00660 [Betaproteobacteria bacterium]|nr:hypothetical protein [Betaproteobacteria bacterium]